MAQKKATEKAKALMKRSYDKAQERKAINVIEQAERKRLNDEYRERGELTPYQQRERDKNKARLVAKYGNADA